MKHLADHKTPRLGARNTKQREAIVGILRETDAFASAGEIHEELQKTGQKVGLTTVYRTLQSLAEIGAVDALTQSNGQTLYRQCIADHHHHHLVCVQCGRTEEIDGGPVERWAQETAAAYGYTVETHEAEVYGLCPTCRAKGVKKQAG